MGTLCVSFITTSISCSDMDYSEQNESHNEGWFENMKKTVERGTEDVRRAFSSPVTRDMLFYLFVGILHSCYSPQCWTFVNLNQEEMKMLMMRVAFSMAKWKK